MAAPMAAHSEIALAQPRATPGGKTRMTEVPAKHRSRSRCYPQKCRNSPGRSSGEARRRPEASPSARAVGPAQWQPTRAILLAPLGFDPANRGKLGLRVLGRGKSFQRLKVDGTCTGRLDGLPASPTLFPLNSYPETISEKSMAANIMRMLDIGNLDKNSLKWLPRAMAAPWMLKIAENQSAAPRAMAAPIVEEEHSLAECFLRKYENSS